MTTMNQLFDQDQMVRLSREGMENAVRFFMTFNENLIKMTDIQKNLIVDANQKYVETINKAYEEYRKNTQVVNSHIENFVKTATEKTLCKEK